MSFFGKLFKGAFVSPKKEEATRVAHGEYQIEADPQQEGQQFRLSGLILKEIDGEMKEHMLIRADMFSSREEATEATIRKAKHVIREQGDHIFRL